MKKEKKEETRKRGKGISFGILFHDVASIILPAISYCVSVVWVWVGGRIKGGPTTRHDTRDQRRGENVPSLDCVCLLLLLLLLLLYCAVIAIYRSSGTCCSALLSSRRLFHIRLDMHLFVPFFYMWNVPADAVLPVRSFSLGVTTSISKQTHILTWAI